MSEGPHLIRLSRLLELRDAPMEPLLEAVSVSGTGSLMVGVSTVSSRLALKMPYRPEALRAVAPWMTAPYVQSHMMLDVLVDGEDMGIAVTTATATSARNAVDDVAPAGARDAWCRIIEQLLESTGGVIFNRTRFLSEEGAAVSVKCSARSDDAEIRFALGLERMMTDLAVSETHRNAWANVYGTAGAGSGVVIRLDCGASGPSPDLGMMFATGSYDNVITLLKVITDVARAREGAVVLGMVAGEVGVTALRGVQLVLRDGEEADIVAWAYFRER